MKKVLFIINPTAGKERMKRYLMSVLDLFTKANWDVTVLLPRRLWMRPMWPKNRGRILI